ncbi:MAG: DNA polymerase/3'-5' exonuclease PolX [Balneolaceae bacterium]|nr:DNA polymerase/3'-5' exonuclease PolX [Balneolaceae bacterium]
MSVTNQEVAEQLREIYRLMQLAGENRFRAIAFDRAAQTVEGLGEDINAYIENDTLTDIKGIGSSIAEDIKSFAESGRIEVLEELRKRIPEGIIRWLEISGLGPKNIAKIHKELDITEIEELKQACLDGRVAALEGLGEKSAEKILKSIEWMEQFEERCRLDEAREVADKMYDFLKGLQGIREIEVAGSLRRSNETIGDIDILIGAEKNHIPSIFDAFVDHELAVEILGRGETKSSIRTREGRQVDLRVVKPEEFPAALLYFTGSKEHNVVMRQRARQRGMSLNEYGLFKLNGQGETDFDRPVEYDSESDIYGHLDLNFIPPELREDRGEFDLFESEVPLDLVENSDIRGVIHAHSTWSDGKFTIEQMAEACLDRGYGYLGITDHSKTAAYAGGLSEEEVKRQWEEIDKLNERYESEGRTFRIFKGIESDILNDGSLDYDEKILEKFDFVIASVHSGLDQPKSRMMERFRNAIRNPFTRIVGHPTGRLLLKRDGSDLDMNELIELAAEHNTAIEINANPMRLDLDWRHGNKAREVGLMSSINPDAHTTGGIDYIRYGIQIARKGKFNKQRILNAKSAEEVKAWFKS